MESRENPVYGRKVFFLNPPFNIRKLVVSRLQELEYEVYVIDDYKNAKNILRHYPDSICFINIDNHDGNQLSVNQWFNFLQSFAEDSVLRTIYTGILSGRTGQSEKNFFLLNASIPAGFISTTDTAESLTESLTEILDINGAKGRRQYVRVKCPSGSMANIKCTVNGVTYVLPVIDISSVGLACEIPESYQNIFPQNTLLRDITIRLNGKPIACSVAVFAIKQVGDKFSLILLLLKGTPYTVKDAIRTYVFTTLREEMVSSIEGEQPDTTDYPNVIIQKDKDAFLIDADENESDKVETRKPQSGQTFTTLY